MLSSNTTEQLKSASLVDVLDAFRAHHPDGDIELLRKACDVATKAHAGQVRKTGDPFITHPLTVAFMLAQHGLDSETIAAAFLHATVVLRPTHFDDTLTSAGKGSNVGAVGSMNGHSAAHGHIAHNRIARHR